MARYVVTGGSGFVGRSLCDRIRADGHEAIVATRGRHKEDDGQHWIEYDLRDRATIANIVQAKPDGIFHLAWSTTPAAAESDPGSDVEVNLVGTVNLFDAVARSGPVPILLASSGGTVYGPAVSLPVDEDHPLNPIGIYGTTKVAAERYAEVFRNNRGLDIRVARLSNPFGARQSVAKLQGAASIFARKVISGEPLLIWGDGSVVRDYVDVDDAADAIYRIMLHSNVGVQGAPIFNVGSGEGISLTELISIVESAAGVKSKTTFAAGRAFDISANILDIGRIGASIGWRPRRPMRDSIVAMVSSMLALGGAD